MFNAIYQPLRIQLCGYLILIIQSISSTSCSAPSQRIILSSLLSLSPDSDEDEDDEFPTHSATLSSALGGSAAGDYAAASYRSDHRNQPITVHTIQPYQWDTWVQDPRNRVIREASSLDSQGGRTIASKLDRTVSLMLLSLI